LLAAALFAAGGGTTRHASAAGAQPLLTHAIAAQAATQPTPTSTCVATRGIQCYSPAQFENAFRLNELHAAGIDGNGETIAIVDSFGSPTIANDLHQFDQTFGVSNPYGVPVDTAIAADPQLTIIHPAGPIPAFDPTNGDMVGWAQETTLDVEWAHVFAPKANILLVESPVSETEGVTGFPEIVTSENYVIDNHLAGVISQSFGATEETFPNDKALLDLRDAFKNAAKNDVTVLGSSGDEGSTDFELNLEDLFPFQVNSWPSSDPLVTSIGGTKVNLADSGTRLSPDVVWNDSNIGIQAASGGGPSHVFNRPDFQNHVKSVVGHSRGTPDVSLNAAVNGGVWVYYTFVGPSSPYHIFGGTSAASPQFAGVVAMAEQVAGKQLGNINKALYSIPYGGGLVDVTSGNNDIGPFQNTDGNTYHVPGFDAGTGYDLATGLGTIDPARFVAALANGAAKGHDNATCTGTMTFASVTGNFTVPKGASCTLTDSVVGRNVDVDGSLTLNGSTVGHDLHVKHGGTLTAGPDAGGEPSIVQGHCSGSTPQCAGL
jgi:subtilase family serine protease